MGGARSDTDPGSDLDDSVERFRLRSDAADRNNRFQETGGGYFLLWFAEPPCNTLSSQSPTHRKVAREQPRPRARMPGGVFRCGGPEASEFILVEETGAGPGVRLRKGKLQ